MILYIENEIQTGLNAGGSFAYRVDDTLDSGTVVVINESSTPFKPYSLCKLDFDGVIEYMWTYADTVQTYTKVNPVKYQHTITLVELTKIAEKFIVPSMVLTDREMTLKDQFVEAIKKVNSYYLNGLYRFEIDTNAQTKLSTYPIVGENVVMSKSTAREVFDEILKSISSRFVITAVESTQPRVLKCGFIDLNEKTESDKDFSNPVFLASASQGEAYGGQMISFVNNATPQTFVNQVDTFKVKYGVTSAGSEKIMSLAWPVEYITKFMLQYNGNVKYTYFIPPTGQPQTGLFNASNIFVEALEKLVDKEYWDTLTQEVQERTLYYVRGEREIDVSRTYKPLLVTYTAIDKILTDIFGKYIGEHWNEIKPEPNATLITNALNDFDTSNVVYKLTYAPLIDTELIVDKTAINGTDTDLTIVDNQSDNIIDIERYGRNLVGKIERTANNELYIDDVEYNYSDILECLTAIRYKVGFNEYKDYVVYQVDFQVMTTYNNGQSSNWYKIRYYLSENFNNLNEKIGIKREKEIYEIPLKGYQTPIWYKKNVNFSTELGDYTIPTDISIARYLAETLCNDNSDGNLKGKQIDYALVGVDRTNNPEQFIFDYFLLPCVCFGAGNTMYLQAKFYDNYSAGLSVNYNTTIFDWVGGKKVSYNPYVNDKGKAFAFKVQYGQLNNPTADQIKALPKSTNFAPITKVTDLSALKIFNKDRAESIILSMRVEVNATENEIVYQNLMKNNRAITQDVPPLYIYINSDRPYKKTDVKCRGTKLGLVENYLQIGKSANSVGCLASPDVSWYNFAIGDTNGNIYYAHNTGFYQDDYFGFATN